ncbi:hypothetical protein [Salmonella enterica]|nr:hypothetical protein [Salmonella enterica]
MDQVYEFIRDNMVSVWNDAMLQHPILSGVMWLLILLMAIFYTSD